MSKKIQDLKNELNKLAADMRALNEKAEKEDRAFTSDEDAKWAEMLKGMDELRSRIDKAEQLAALGEASPAALRAATPQTDGNQTDGEQVDKDVEYRSAFNEYLRSTPDNPISPEARNVLAGRRVNLSDREQRALGTGAGNTGGYSIPQDFLNNLEVALRAYGGMLEAAQILRTDTGALLPMATFNYTAVAATIVGEGSQGGQDTSTPFGVANLGSYTYRTPILPVSYELLQDSAFGEQYLIDALGISLSRGLNAHFTTGTGSGQPRGILTDAVAGKVGATGTTLAVGYSDLLALLHSIDPAYRAQNCSWMMHDTSLRAVRDIKDANGRPIYMPGWDGMAGDLSDKIMGKTVVINQDMPVMAANAKSILFGRLDKYKARIVKDVTVMRLTERYADNMQVAFLLFMRADGRLLDAGTNPVKYFQNSAT